MAGGYKCIVNKHNKFIGLGTVENLGDAYEALEECHELIKQLGGTKETIYQAAVMLHAKKFPDEHFPFSYNEFWDETICVTFPR